MHDLKLYMILLGCKPAARNTEQHDVFFGIGETLSDVKKDILNFWKEANGKIHIDAWREVKQVDGFKISVEERDDPVATTRERLFFINLGGYKPNEFEEYHYKMLTVSTDKGTAIQKAKQTAFYKHTGFDGASSHIDDKYGIDVDDVYEIEDVLPENLKNRFCIRVELAADQREDRIHLGYLKMEKI